MLDLCDRILEVRIVDEPVCRRAEDLLRRVEHRIDVSFDHRVLKQMSKVSDLGFGLPSIRDDVLRG